MGAKKISLKDSFGSLTTSERLLQAVNEAEKGNDIPFYLINICDLPENSYSWLMMLKKRYTCFNVFALSVLESGTVVMDFESTRHFRSWFVASLKGKEEEPTRTLDGNFLNMWKENNTGDLT